jgi:peptide/nickel transport system substrate-binding protein
MTIAILTAPLSKSRAIATGLNQSNSTSKLGTAAPPAKSSHTVLRIGIASDFETLNPLVNSMMSAVYVLDATLRPLVALSPSGDPYPVLIEKIPNLKDGSAELTKDGGLKAEVRFRKAAAWGDGEPVTCQDFFLAWTIGKSERVSIPNRQDYLNILSVQWEPSDPKLCSIVFKEAHWNFYLELPRPLSSHLEKSIFEKYKDEAFGYERNSNYARKVAQAGLYNGPYVVTDLRLGQSISLALNPHFYGPQAHIPQIQFKFILNTSALESALLSGDIQMTSASGFSFDQALAFEKKIQEKRLPFQSVMVTSTSLAHVDLNLDNPILSDVHVRQALMFAFDQESLVKAFFENRQKPALHFSYPQDQWYTDKPSEISIYKYSRSKAEALLDSAGWKRSDLGDGVRQKDGKKLKLTLSGVSDLKLNEMLEVYLQSAFRKVGVEVQIKNYPARVFFSEIVRHRNFDMALYSWVEVPNHVPRLTFAMDSIPSAENSWSGNNRIGWRNAKASEGLIQASAEFDSQKRVVLMKKVLKAFTEDVPMLPAYYKTTSSVIPQGLQNYALSGHTYSEFLKVEEWVW